MIEVNLLGTGGYVPLPERYLTSLYLKYNGNAVLVDCGEGTQVAVRAAGLGFKQIGVICLTHFHADHVSGLPGLLLTIGNSGRTEPVVIIGPKHVKYIVESLCIIAPQLPFQLNFIEIEKMRKIQKKDRDNSQICNIFNMESLIISAEAVEHWIPCYAYKFTLKRQGKFNPEKAKSLGIPVKYWSVLQAGNSVGIDGRIFEPFDIMGRERKGLTVCYATDLRPSDALTEFAADSDLFICEGMYGDSELFEKAVEHRHCLFSEAAETAKKARVKELWLTHFSPSMAHPEEYIANATAIFPNTSIDKKRAVLVFEE